jgi:hypothetical protein
MGESGKDVGTKPKTQGNDILNPVLVLAEPKPLKVVTVGNGEARESQVRVTASAAGADSCGGIQIPYPLPDGRTK